MRVQVAILRVDANDHTITERVVGFVRVLMVRLPRAPPPFSPVVEDERLAATGAAPLLAIKGTGLRFFTKGHGRSVSPTPPLSTMKLTHKCSAPPSQAPRSTPPPGAVRPRRPRREERRGRNPLPATLAQRRCNIFVADAPALASAANAAGISEPTAIAHAIRIFVSMSASERARHIIGGPQMEEAT
jgi:hypothetical protein